jgi:hypothetical protein
MMGRKRRRADQSNYCGQYNLLPFIFHNSQKKRIVPAHAAPTRHLGANKEYASKSKYFTIKNRILLNTTKCRVGGETKVGG